MEMAFRRNHKNQDTRTSLGKGKESMFAGVYMSFGCTAYDLEKVLVALIFTTILPSHRITSHLPGHQVALLQ